LGPLRLRLRPTLRRRLTLLFLGQFLAALVALVLLTWLLFTYAPKTPVTFIVDMATSSFVTSKFENLTPAQRANLESKQQIAVLAERETLRQLAGRWTLAAGLTALLAVGAGWFVAGRLLSPLQRITAAARRLSGSTLDQRIGMTGANDELKELADTFDGMLDRLQRAFESQRHFVANASHELRSPLAEQRALVDVTLADRSATEADLRAALRQVRTGVDEQERIMEGLLALARSERGVEGRAPLDLREPVERALAGAAGDLDARRISVRAELRPAPVAGDRALLERLAGNLVENAIRHNRPEGWVRARTGAENGHVLLEVSNSGDPIDAGAVPGLFEPFRRLALERTGTAGLGLGLSIVRAVATAHGGDVRAVPGPEGGLTVTVSLPRS
jgi:signal transduction histidine kinase